MEISYRREIKHNYLVVMPEHDQDAGYEARMLAGNGIQGLLRMYIKYQDGFPLYYYDITSRQPLGRLLETRFITRQEICQILVQIHVILMRMEEYLLSDSGIILEPELIYMEPELFQIGLCLVPGQEGDFPQRLSSFLQYILKCVNHKDRECVVLAYGMYQESLKDNYGMDDILKLIVPESRKDDLEADDIKADSIRVNEPLGNSSYAHKKGTDNRYNADSYAYEFSQDTKGKRAAQEILYLHADRKKMLPDIKKQFAVWLATVILLPAALWLFKGEHILRSFRTILICLDGGLLIAMAAGDILLLLWNGMRKRKNSSDTDMTLRENSGSSTDLGRKAHAPCSRLGRPKSGTCNFVPGMEAVEPEDSPWKILCAEEEDEEWTRHGGPQNLDGKQGSDNTEADLEESFQTTLLTERAVEEEVRRLTPLNSGWEEIIISYYPFVIGKHKDLADYVLPKDTVSRFHVRFDRDKDTYTVTDLNSTNGTSVKGRILDANETAAIEIGDEVYIADLGYIFY